jgi:Family of unknown function (DUF6498)
MLSDPSLWVLIGINVYLIYYYYHHPEIFTTLIWLYWVQSVLLGLFNFVDMLTVRKVQPDSIKINGKKSTESNLLKAPGAFFFLLHYGAFHFVYLIFIASMKRSGPFQWEFFKYFFIVFLAGQIITFVQHKIQQRKTAVNLGTMFFLPYLRIIPMHLTIILPSFLGISNLGIFLILKSVADVLMYIVTRPRGNSAEADKMMMATKGTNF